MGQDRGSSGPSCPIAPGTVDDGAARIAALLVLALAVVSMGSGRGLVALGLAADFLLRAAGRTALSPVARVAEGIRRGMRLPDRPVNAGPKRFAAALGSLLAAGTGLALALNHPVVGTGLATILAACATLDGLFGFCLGCRIHGWLPHPTSRAVPEARGLS